MRPFVLLIALLPGCDTKTDYYPYEDDTADTGSADADGDGAVAGLDCDDSDPSAYPGALEECDGADNDCDGSIDEGFDADSDGATSCGGDCDDSDPSIRPGVTESCDGVDNNCDGTIDEGMSTVWYADDDGDGYGDPTHISESCTQPSGYVSDNTDCDDDEVLASPAWEEVCDDLIDNDCDGDTDEDCTGGGGGGGGTNTGYEVFEYGNGSSGTRSCDMLWDTAWTATTASGCPGCTYIFDVDYTYDSASSYNDGTCSVTWYDGKPLDGDHRYRYGYTASYSGVGEAVLYNYNGGWYFWFYAALNSMSGKFTYTYGYEDYPYAGRYYTYYQYGSATITQ